MAVRRSGWARGPCAHRVRPVGALAGREGYRRLRVFAKKFGPEFPNRRPGAPEQNQPSGPFRLSWRSFPGIRRTVGSGRECGRTFREDGGISVKLVRLVRKALPSKSLKSYAWYGWI
ncbi:tryptorubin family RiPP precursor [Amycolatopsis halotolerans]|uniref:tryptorubin family RiPP precursor n=1 Tax=Amycolatopsis halotolerans TaxID=330083 RepID=UPI0036128D4F